VGLDFIRLSAFQCPNSNSFQMYALNLAVTATASAAIIGLFAFSKPSMGAAIQKRDDTDKGQVNYYSDTHCKSYAGTWAGADSMYNNKDYTVDNLFVGSVIGLFTDANTWDSLDLDNDEYITGNALCPSDAKPPILRDGNGNDCYFVNRTITKVELYTQQCAVIPSEKKA
jgi:hypothetical protein